MTEDLGGEAARGGLFPSLALDGEGDGEEGVWPAKEAKETEPVWIRCATALILYRNPLTLCCSLP